MKPLTKYPRTPHLPWSPGGTSDDTKLTDTSHFEGKEVVVTEKMDGENTTMYSDLIHARSIDSRHHASRDWVKALHAQVGLELPEGWRLCGENLYAQHSVQYEDLASYFYLFSVWNEENVSLEWSFVKWTADVMKLALVPVLYIGLWDEGLIKDIKVDESKVEGYVVRTTEEFHYDDFATHAAKWVRPNHVQTDQHWMHAEIIPNKLKDE